MIFFRSLITIMVKTSIYHEHKVVGTSFKLQAKPKKFNRKASEWPIEVPKIPFKTNVSIHIFYSFQHLCPTSICVVLRGGMWLLISVAQNIAICLSSLLPSLFVNFYHSQRMLYEVINYFVIRIVHLNISYRPNHSFSSSGMK